MTPSKGTLAVRGQRRLESGSRARSCDGRAAKRRHFLTAWIAKPLRAAGLCALLCAAANSRGQIPTISQQPTNLVVSQGSPAAFMVSASGGLPLAYQWYFFGAAIANATNATLPLAGVNPGQAGDYGVIITNSFGSVVSSNAVLTVNPSLVINGGFETGDFTGWTQSGNTSFTFVTNTPTYVHSGGFGAQLGPSGSPGILTQTLPTVAGQAYLISFWLYCPPQTPNSFSVSWNGGTIFSASNFGTTGWTNIQLMASGAAPATPLQFTFSDNPSYMGLDDISVSPIVPAFDLPSIQGQSGYETVTAGDTATFTVTANGAAPLGFQWFLNGASLADNGRITGSFTSTLTVSNAQVADAGYYTVLVYNAYAQTDSQQSLLTVRPALGTYGSAYTFTTLAGYPGSGAADGVGSAAQFQRAQGVAADTNGNVYISDTENDTIRRLTPAGVVTTIAGFPGAPGSSDGVGSAARFFGPGGLAVGPGGALYVSDQGNYTIRKMTPVGTNWQVTTIAGKAGVYGYTDGTNGGALFEGPNDVAVDSSGILYVTDYADEIRRIAPNGTNWVVTTIAGQANVNDYTNGPGLGAAFRSPNGLTLDGGGNIFVADTGNNVIREISPVGTNWVASTIAGSLMFGSTDGTNTAALFNSPVGIARNAAGNLFVADTGNADIREMTPSGTNWIVRTFAGFPQKFGTVDGTGTNAHFYSPYSVAVDGGGNVFVVDFVENVIRKITPAGVVKTVAGTSVDDSKGAQNGTGRAARFNMPSATAVDSAGNVYVADEYNFLIRQITPAGVVTTMAGSLTNPGSADGAGSDANFNYSSGIAVDSLGNVFVTDAATSIIRKITPAGVVTTIAGLANALGFADGTNSVARFAQPVGIAMDAAGNLYVSDSGNSTVRKLSLVGTNWVVTTIAGSATNLQGSADGTNAAAQFTTPVGAAVDSQGNVYVCDSENSTIRKIAPVGTNWVVTTIAGFPQYAGNVDGLSTNSRFGAPYSIAVDSADNLYVADASESTIRKLIPTGDTWLVTTLGGLPGFLGSEDGAGDVARFADPSGIAADSQGNIYIADSFNNTIRKGTFSQYASTNPIPFVAPAMNGQLSVTLLPPEANGQWRFPWELGWRNSGTIAHNLAAGNYTVQFRDVPGYLAIPSTLPVAVQNNSTFFLTNQYYPTAVSAGAGAGSLTVNIGPSPPAQAAWQFLGDAAFFAPGFTTNLPPGNYLIGFRAAANYVTPPNLSVQVFAGQPAVISVSYLLASPAPGNVELPVPVPVNQVNDLKDYPFGFNGQLQSDTGYGSGVAVQTNVVLTAAHVVFDDQTQSFVTQVYWYFQQEAGAYTPQPMSARGWYVLSGYAAQRTNDLGRGYAPDESSAESRNLDVAAVYFSTPAAGGGFGGYLPSDEFPNPWLTGTAQKMLVGYPVDGSQFGDASIVPGEMYQTTPQPYPLSLGADQVNERQEVYTAGWFLGYPGDSGGPLYVQFNGYFYPAGIYLGSLYNGSVYLSAVRSFDSNVVNLINLAQTQGDNGTNHTGGGVITIVPTAAISASHPGYVQWHLGPPAALLAGGGWRLVGDNAYSSATNYTRAVLNTNSVAVEFKPIPGWNLPANVAISITPDQITVYNAFYTVNNPALVAGPTMGIALTGTTGTMYRIESRTSLTSGNWQPLRTNTITSSGLNLVLPPPATNQPATFYRAVWLP